MSLSAHSHYNSHYNHKSGTDNLDYACNELQSGKNNSVIYIHYFIPSANVDNF